MTGVLPIWIALLALGLLVAVVIWANQREAALQASEARASGLDWAGYFAAEQGDDPIPLLEASRRCARDVGAIATAALATSHLSVFLPVDRVQEMLPLGEEAVRLARASGVRWVLGVALNVLGETLRMAGIGKLKAGTTSIEEVVGNTAPDTTR